MAKVDEQQGRATESSSATGGADVLPALLVCDDRGMKRNFEISLDEAVRREADGNDVTLRLDPAATLETLQARLLELSGEGEVYPVCYEADGPHTRSGRRLITPDITVQLPPSGQLPALPAGLVLKELPDYAPGFAIVAAANPFSAMTLLGPLRQRTGIVAANLQLASLRSLKAMPNDPLVGNQWHLKYQGQTGAVSGSDVNVEGAWQFGGSGGVRGGGIRIGVVDDGIQLSHPDLLANVDTANDKDWIGNDNDPSPGNGDYHGTACAGNAAARGNNGVGVTGTAPEATLVGMRLISGTFAVTDAQEAEAMGYLPQLIQIKSNSWGPDDTSHVVEGPGPLARASIANAAATGRGGLGTIFVWAGGNGREYDDNSNYDGYANDIHTIAVAASDCQTGQSYYSEPGANLIVAAPSDGGTLSITTTDLVGKSGYNRSSSAAGGDYTSNFGGTSSATPSVAGIVALMLQKNPALGWRDVQEILIRSAVKVSPGDGDWSDNAAGFHFNHKFGAGRVDAAAAVALAGGWTNLGAAASQSVAMSGGAVSIPDNNPTGVTRTFGFTGTELRVEQVEVRVDITHTYRGDLEILLTSPSGTVSRLAEARSDSADDYQAWTFSSVRCWGESSTGNWTLRVIDEEAVDVGSLTGATLTVHGSVVLPENPGPTVQITSPATASVFASGATVAVSVAASDLNADGSAGSIASVQLLDDGAVIATDASAPFEFSFVGDVGEHQLTAVATDGEGASAVSDPVSISVAVGGYDGWIAGFPALQDISQTGDPDHDGLANVVEYYLGSLPDTPDLEGVQPVIERDGTNLTLTWWRSKSAEGVTGSAEWSDGLGAWQTIGVVTGVVAETASHQQMRAVLTLAPEDSRKFLHLRVEEVAE